MTIKRSTGISVPGWYGPRPGGGYRGETEELDAAVQGAADRLEEEYGQDVEIRFNSNRKSGGAFLPCGAGFGAGLKIDRSDGWRPGDPITYTGELYHDVYVPGTALRGVEPNCEGFSPYFSKHFDTQEEAWGFFREHVDANTREEAS